MAGDAFVNVTQCATADEARAAATHLVERGIGATVAKLPAPPGDAAADGLPFAVQVLADQEARARELLDAPPDPSPSDPSSPDSAPSDSAPSEPSSTSGSAGDAAGSTAVAAGDAPREAPSAGPADGLAAGPAAGPAGAVPPLGDTARPGRWGDGAGGIGVTGPLDEDDEPMELEKGPIPWKKVLLIWAAALILIPLAAFWLTYLILSR